VASCPSSRGQIGLTAGGAPACGGAPGGGGGGGCMPGCICANALVLSSKLPSSAAQVSIFLAEKAFDVSGMYPANRDSARLQGRGRPIAASSGSVTSFPRPWCGGNLKP